MTDDPDSIEQSIESMTASWLERARAGDGDAWNRLIATYRRLIAWWCRRSGVPQQDVDDLLQEILAAVARALPEYRHESFRGFLWSITCFKVQDYWRTHFREPNAEGGTDVQELLQQVEAESSHRTGPVDIATKLLFDAIVEFVRGEFSEKDWTLFQEYAVEGKDARSVAESNGVSRNQVFLAKSRIMRQIRAQFGDRPG